MVRSIYWDIKEGLLHRLFVFLVLMAAIFFCAGCRSISSSESHDLEQTLRIAIESFQGEVGVYVRKLDGSCEVAIGADELYPTASLIKVPIVMALLDKVEVGQLDWNRPIVYRTSQRSTVGEDLMAKFKDGSEISLDKLKQQGKGYLPAASLIELDNALYNFDTLMATEMTQALRTGIDRGQSLQ